MLTKAKIINIAILSSIMSQYRNRLAKNIVLSLLATMRLGQLKLYLPDGSKKIFGKGKGNIWATIRVHNEAFFWRCLLYADIGLAESYLDELCDFSSIKNTISWFLLNHSQSPLLNESGHSSHLLNLLGFTNRILHLLRANSKSNSRRNIADHYDLGNQFFQTFLDNTMTYSSALFMDRSMTLEDAQQAKFQRIAKQLQISSQDKVLDLGCGWGGLSVYLAKTFGCSVTAITLSRQQYEYIKELIERQSLNNLIDLRLEDYRNLRGEFDKIVSIEMIEAVGDEYMNLFISKLNDLLKTDGLLLMQMITCPDSRYEVLKSNVDFIQKYIFPGGLLPSLYRVSSAMHACSNLCMVDLFDMTPSYVITLLRWQTSFEENLSKVRLLGFDERLIRKWLYYFEYCQAAFQMRNVSVVQATYSRPNNRKFYGGVI